jgi:hypothetical protein
MSTRTPPHSRPAAPEISTETLPPIATSVAGAAPPSFGSTHSRSRRYPRQERVLYRAGVERWTVREITICLGQCFSAAWSLLMREAQQCACDCFRARSVGGGR